MQSRSRKSSALNAPNVAPGMAQSPVMGASGWLYIVPFQQDISLALSDLQRRVFDDRDYYWDEQDESIDRTSLETLLASKESEEFWEVGTHSILDMDRVIGADQPEEIGAVRALSPEQVLVYLGSEHPTRTDFERAVNVQVEAGESPPIDSGYIKWSGRYAVLHRDGVPHEIAFWGWSGD